MNNETSFPKNDKKEIFGWMVYDWANSAFYTTVIGVLIQPYLISLAQDELGKGGIVFTVGPIGSVTAESLPSFCLGLSVFLQIFFLPVLGAIADYTHLKKKLMAVFCYAGVLASSSLFLITGDKFVIGAIALMIANMCFAAANVFYNAFLNDITTEDRRDRVSSYGFASGYIGGVIMLVLNLLLINNAEALGLSTGMAVRLSILGASLWWGIFAVFSFYRIKSRAPEKSIDDGKNIITIGFSELLVTLKQLKGLKYTMMFLGAYLLYNDGIQTVILSSSAFLSQEISDDSSFLVMIFIIAQFAALIGSLGFERIARVIGAKRTILISLAIWCAIVIFAYGFLNNKVQAYIMGFFIGLVLGSAQALSRSLYSQMIPRGRESSFFGLYEISEKGTSWLGQLVFTIVVGITGSFRQAILALIFFFVAGSIVLLLTDTTKAIHEAGNLTPEEAESIEPVV
ncbi:MAG: MFS transporter [Pyrinomonadaceae bacterium]|nr:MFS transporter [Pyrinomonadaceae bacterium]